MSAPQVSGVAALVLSAHPELRNRPAALQAQLVGTANTAVVNHTGPSSPSTAAAWNGTPCAVGFCHVSWTTPIPFALAYGAGMVDAAKAVSTTVAAPG
jgi:hypothetical protein